MAGTFTRLLYHVVFSTKHRANLIAAELRPRLYEYLADIFADRARVRHGLARHEATLDIERAAPLAFEYSSAHE
jgi:REP element-mobilizing transposase RayT